LEDEAHAREALITLWKEILELPDVSPDDDFFLSGGNSLTAIELLIKIQREFHVSLPPDTIYRLPTIREQAALLQAKAGTTKEYHPLIVPLREEGTLPPLFCIHPLGGWMDHYLKLLPAVDNSRPVFGIRGRGLEPGETLPTTVEETAREEVEAIKTVQATGPYHLIGFSNGGIIGFELACQLQEKGESVGFLGLIDVSLPGTEARYVKTLAARIFPGRLKTIPAFFENYLKSHPGSRIYKGIMKSVRWVVHGLFVRSPSKSLPESVSENHAAVHIRDTLERFPEGNRPTMKVQLMASWSYLPHTFRGDVVLFSTGPDQILYPGDMTRGWGSVISGRCEVIPVPGTHPTLFDEPHLSVLIGKVRHTLDAYQ
jgi:thioesterase domain-containing protein/acyl carrier protein